MNQETLQFLEQLAAKLGTTSEYLWGVLVSQAKWDAFISFIQMAFMAAWIYWNIKLHLKFCKNMPGENYTYYAEYEAMAGIPMIIAGILSCILFFFFLNGFNDLISSIVNPEYWALRRLIHIH